MNLLIQIFPFNQSIFQSINQYLLIQIKNIQKQYYAPTESRARKAGAVQMHRKKNTTSRHTNNSKKRKNN